MALRHQNYKKNYMICMKTFNGEAAGGSPYDKMRR